MKRYYVEEAKVGVTEGGIACGPIPGSVVVSIKYRENDNQSLWLSNVEVEGIANPTLSEKDIFDVLVTEEMDNTEFDKYFITEFNNIELDPDYYGTFEKFTTDPENPAIPLIRLLIVLTRCKREEEDTIINSVVGRFADEIDVPLSDIEMDYLEDEDVE